MSEFTKLSVIATVYPHKEVICNSNIDFSKMKEVMADKMVVYTGIGFCGSCQIVGWKETNTQYVMVSMLHSENMIKALTKA